MRLSAFLTRVFFLVVSGILVGQTTPAPLFDKSDMHQHYDAAYRFQTSGDFARADIEHKYFLVAALHRLANFYANTGDYLHAAPAYEEALQLLPTDFPLLMDYAGASLDASDPQKARGLLQVVAGLDTARLTDLQKADVHFMLGRTLRGLGNTKAAIEEFHAAIAIEPNIENYSALAGAVLELHGSEGASSIFTQIIARFGDSAAVHMRIGRIYALLGFPDRAIEEFKRAVALDYKMPEVHYSLGAAYMSNLASELGLAEAEFRKELQLHPDDIYCYQQLGYIALRHLNYREAELEFHHAVAVNPTAQVFADLGKVYLDTGRPAEAEAAFRKAIALTVDPSRNEYAIERVHYQLGRLLVARGADAEGEEELQIAQQLLSQRDSEAELTLKGQPIPKGVLDRTRVATAQEIEDLQRFVKQITPLMAGSYNNLGYHAAMGAEYAKAAVYFQRAAKWDPGLAGVDSNWGRAAFAAHDCEQAITPLRRALETDSSNGELAAMLNQCRAFVLSEGGQQQ